MTSIAGLPEYRGLHTLEAERDSAAREHPASVWLYVLAVVLGGVTEGDTHYNNVVTTHPSASV
jgi:hypothetical protein